MGNIGFLSGLLSGFVCTALVCSKRPYMRGETPLVSTSPIQKSMHTEVTSLLKPPCSRVVKATPSELFADCGTGTDYETRPSKLGDFITSNDRFYIRSHSPTPTIQIADWRLKIDGNGVNNPLQLCYEELCGMPQVNLSRTLECAGNGRQFFEKDFGRRPEGVRWRLGAIGCAEWSGVRLRDVLERSGVTKRARDVMPEGLDESQVRRAIPIEKAMREDTLLVLKMNGETLLPDHGYPLRMLVPGWAAVASIKWLGRIQVSEEPLYSPYNTTSYIMTGAEYPPQFPALGLPITELPLISLLDLDWPAEISVHTTVIRGRSFAGEAGVREVVYSIDDQPWQPAELIGPNISGCWRRWQFDWSPRVGKHWIRIRATDDRGFTQPDQVPWNDRGYLYNAVVSHPVIVR